MSERMSKDIAIEMLKWLQDILDQNDNLKPIEYYTFTTNTEHSEFSTSFSTESKELCSQALDYAIIILKAFEPYERKE